MLLSAHPEMVNFGSGQGRSNFSTAGIPLIAGFRGLKNRENAALGQKMPFLDGHYLTEGGGYNGKSAAVFE
jgi:hypothetical protein